MIDYTYTKYGQLAGKYLGGKLNPEASVEYEYSKSGKIIARTANGIRQTYEYDGRGQLLAVVDADGNAVEKYTYDKAGNMLKKTVNGKTTTFTFDGANQLVSSTTDGVTTTYEYDAAGRLVREGDRQYKYGYLDKVLSVTEGEKVYSYAYHPDGQLANANYGDSSEEFLWDGLALIGRGDEKFINEPHIGGGNPVVSSKGTSYFNDMLGTTVGTKNGRKYSVAALTAFGEDLNHHSKPTPSTSTSFFTGKPYVEGLGRTFLMRNYRANLAKWQTADPLGYPDGWNALAYCGNDGLHLVDVGGTFSATPPYGHWTDHPGVSKYYYFDDICFTVVFNGICNHDYSSPSIELQYEIDPYDYLEYHFFIVIRKTEFEIVPSLSIVKDIRLKVWADGYVRLNILDEMDDVYVTSDCFLGERYFELNCSVRQPIFE